MSSSASLPSPDNDYTAPLDARLNKAFWDTALKSVGARIRALEAVKVTWEELISAGTGQALAVIQANVEPQLVALNGVINSLKSEVAAAEDAIAVITAGGINMTNVAGLSTALALKANISDVEATIAALKGNAPAAFDTLVEIATKLSEDDAAIAGLLTTIATKASKETKLKVGAGLLLDGVAGSNAAPVEGDLSADRLIALDLEAKALASELWLAGTSTVEAPVSPEKLAAAIGALAPDPSAVTCQEILVSGIWTKPADLSPDALILVFCWGGGGGGYTSTAYRGGGGGGSCSWAIWKASQLPATVPVTIGAGGPPASTGGTTDFNGQTAVGGAGGNQNGGAGGDSGFGSAFAGAVGGSGNGPSNGANAFWGGGGGAGQYNSTVRQGGTSVMGGAGGGSQNGFVAQVPGGGASNGLQGAAGMVRLFIIE